jgi:hypothetical protein
VGGAATRELISCLCGWSQWFHNLGCVLQEVLDADDAPLKNKFGEVMSRDIVQFVPLRKFQGDTSADHALVSHTYLPYHSPPTSSCYSAGQGDTC